MTGPFLAITLLIAILLLNWRLVLVLVAACLLALMAIGAGLVTEPVSVEVATPGRAPTTVEQTDGPPGPESGRAVPPS